MNGVWVMLELVRYSQVDSGMAQRTPLLCTWTALLDSGYVS